MTWLLYCAGAATGTVAILTHGMGIDKNKCLVKVLCEQFSFHFRLFYTTSGEIACDHLILLPTSTSVCAGGGGKGTMAPEFQRDLRMVGTFHAKFFYFTSSFLHGRCRNAYNKHSFIKTALKFVQTAV